MARRGEDREGREILVRDKRILILTADAGFGHRSAANAVAAALQERYGDRCAVTVANPLDDRRVPAFLRHSQADYDRIVREMPKLYRMGYEATDAPVPSRMMESALTVMLFEAMRDLVRQHGPDAIVTTYPLYHAPLHALRAIGRRHVHVLTVVTDLAMVHRVWFHEVTDLCVVPTPTVRDIALEYGLPAEKVQVVGIPIDPGFARESRDRAAIRAELGWRPDLATVLAVGGTRVGRLYDVVRAFNHSALPIQLVVVGGGDEALHRLLLETDWHGPAYVCGLASNMPTMMHAADCIVCKAGGLIVTEALACGLPLLLIAALPGQEEGNAAYVVDGGAGERAEDPLAALEVLHHWLDGSGALLAQRAENARRLGRPLAAYDVAEQAWAAAVRRVETSGARYARTRRAFVKLLGDYGIPIRDEGARGSGEL